MGLPSITIPMLDPAGPVDDVNDLLLIRQGLNDRKIPAGQIMQTRLTGLPMLPGQLVASDVLLVGRNTGGGYVNYIMPPQYLGFLNGTNCWFYQAAAPLGWTLIPNTGDRVIACSDNVNKYNGANAPSQTASWQQANHVLTIAQIPPHTHSVGLYEQTSGNNTGKLGPGKNNKKDDILTTSTGGGQGHNHGSTWRPRANVGIICTKDKAVGA